MVFKRFTISGPSSPNNLNDRKRNSRSKTNKRRVTFIDQKDDQVDQFDPAKDSEHKQIWFSRNEEDQFRERDYRMSVLLQTQLTPTELEIKTGECPRGLEHAVSASYSRQLDQRRVNSMAAVVTTQTLFRTQGRDGTDSIARAYGSVCEMAKHSAIQRAQDDAKFVNDHVRMPEMLTNRKFEKRNERPSVIGRQYGRRSIGTSY